MDPSSIYTTDFVLGKSDTLDQGEHTFSYQESLMWFLNLFISISILCTLISTSSPGPPHANTFLPSIQTFSQVHPYCPYTTSSNQRNKKEWEKMSLYSWFLFLEPQRLGRIKRKSQACACQKTNEACQELLRSAVTYMAVLPNFKHLLQILDELNSNQMVAKKF